MSHMIADIFPVCITRFSYGSSISLLRRKISIDRLLLAIIHGQVFSRSRKCTAKYLRLLSLCRIYNKFICIYCIFIPLLA